MKSEVHSATINTILKLIVVYGYTVWFKILMVDWKKLFLNLNVTFHKLLDVLSRTEVR